MCIVHYFFKWLFIIDCDFRIHGKTVAACREKGEELSEWTLLFCVTFLSTSSSSLSLFLSLLLLLSLFLSPLLNSWYYHYWWALHSGRGQSWVHVHFIVQVILFWILHILEFSLSLSLLLIVYQCTSWVITLFAPRRLTISSLQESQWDMGHTCY